MNGREAASESTLQVVHPWGSDTFLESCYDQSVVSWDSGLGSDSLMPAEFPMCPILWDIFQAVAHNVHSCPFPLFDLPKLVGEAGLESVNALSLGAVALKTDPGSVAGAVRMKCQKEWTLSMDEG